MTEKAKYLERKARYDWHKSQQDWHELYTHVWPRSRALWHRRQAKWHKAQANAVLTFSDLVSLAFQKNTPALIVNLSKNNTLFQRLANAKASS